MAKRVATTMEDLLEVEPVGELSLKGFQRPVAAYNIVGLKASNRDPAT